MEVVQVYKVYKSCTDVLRLVNLSGTLQDLLKTDCKIRHKDSHLRLGSLFPSCLPIKILHAPLFLSRSRMGEHGLD